MGKVKTKLIHDPLNSQRPYYSGLLEIIQGKEYIVGLEEGSHYQTFSGSYKDRPLVLISKGNKKITNPEKWQLVKQSKKKEINFKLVLVKKLGGEVSNCIVHGTNIPNTVLKQKIHIKDVDIVEHYKSKSGLYIYSAKINTEYTCDGPIIDSFFYHWFYGYDKKVQFLGTRLKLIDMGDFDSDGKNEWLFQYQNYNLDGYIIYYDSFKKKREFTWLYH